MSEHVSPRRFEADPDLDSNRVRSVTLDKNVGTGEAFGGLEFRRTLGKFATGVTVVSMMVPDATTASPTQAAPECAFGITVNAFMSVSLEPALIAISIDKAAHAHATLTAAEYFGVSVLAEDQQYLSDHFAGRRVDMGLEPFEELSGFPVVAGAIAQLVCRSYQSFEAGDHTIFLGEVLALRHEDGRPLIFHGGRYDNLGK